MSKIKQPCQSAFINIGIGIMTEKRILKKFFRIPRADEKEKIIPKIMSNNSERELSDVCSVKGNI